MKKIVSLCLIIVLTMMLSLTAGAADEKNMKSVLADSKNGNIIIKDITDSTDMKAAAADLINVQIVGYGFMNNKYPEREGHFAVIVSVLGSGACYASFDGKPINYLDYAPLLSSGNVAIGWEYLYDCGVLTPGEHVFEITVRSYVSAEKEKNASLIFTYTPAEGE